MINYNTLSYFNALKLILLSLILLPSTSISAAIRLDYFLVVTLAIYFMLNGVKLNKFSSLIIVALLMLPCFIGLALFIQYFTFNFTIASYTINFLGFLRPAIYAFVFTVLLQSMRHLDKLFIFVQNLLVISALITILEYFDIVFLEDIINIVYRGMADSDVGNRAIGLFYRVHGAAYFALFSFIFVYSILSHRHKRFSTRHRLVLIIIAISMIVTFSKSAMLVLLIFLISKNTRIFKLHKRGLFWTLITISGLVLFLQFSEYFEKHVFALVNGIILLITFGDLYASESAGFITGRLGHGWMNALSVWEASPIFGNINHGTFVGDGGYTEVLANHGVLGIIGYLCLFGLLFRCKGFGNKKNKNLIIICFMIAMVPVGLLMERSSEFIVFLLLFIRHYEKNYPHV